MRTGGSESNAAYGTPRKKLFIYERNMASRALSAKESDGHCAEQCTTEVTKLQAKSMPGIRV